MFVYYMERSYMFRHRTVVPSSGSSTSLAKIKSKYRRIVDSPIFTYRLHIQPLRTTLAVLSVLSILINEQLLLFLSILSILINEQLAVFINFINFNQRTTLAVFINFINFNQGTTCRSYQFYQF